MNASTTKSTSNTGSDSSEGGTGEGPSPSAGSSPSTGDADNPPEPGAVPHWPEIDVSIDSTVDGAVDTVWLVDHARLAVEHLSRLVPHVTFAGIGVSVVGDERMITLHREHCGLETTTDVLTFALSEPPDPIDVEIAICADEAARRGAERDHSIERELLLYIVHGLLHCCGFDDHDDADFASMHETEDAILEAIGVGRTFNATDPPRGAEEGREP